MAKVRVRGYGQNLLTAGRVHRYRLFLYTWPAVCIKSVYSDLSQMTYSINWPITVRSAVPFRKLYIPDLNQNGLRQPHPKQKNLVFRVWASDKPTPSLSKLTYNYNSILTYIRVSFLFFFPKKRFRLVFFIKNRVRVSFCFQDQGQGQGLGSNSGLVSSQVALSVQLDGALARRLYLNIRPWGRIIRSFF